MDLSSVSFPSCVLDSIQPPSVPAARCPSHSILVAWSPVPSITVACSKGSQCCQPSRAFNQWLCFPRATILQDCSHKSAVVLSHGYSPSAVLRWSKKPGHWCTTRSNKLQCDHKDELTMATAFTPHLGWRQCSEVCLCRSPQGSASLSWTAEEWKHYQ